MKTIRRLFLLCVTAFFFSGCTADAGSISTTSNPTQELNPPSSPSESLTPAETVVLSSTPSPSASPTPTPMVPPTSEIITKENMQNLKLLATWGKGRIVDAKWLFDDRLLIVHTKAGVFIFDTEDWSLVKEWFGGKALAVSHNREVVAVGFGGGSAVFWNAKTNRQGEIHQSNVAPADPTEYPDALWLNVDGSVLAIAARGNTIRLWDTNTASLQRKLPECYACLSIALSPDGSIVAGTAENLNTVRVWWMTEWDEYITFQNQSRGAGYISDYPFSPDGRMMVTVDRYNAIVWYFHGGGAPSYRLIEEGDNTRVNFSDDGQYLIVNDYETIIRVSDGQHMSADSIDHPDPKPIPDLSSFTNSDYFPGSITGAAIGSDGTPIGWGVSTEEASPFLWWRIQDQTIATPDWNHCEDLQTSFNFGSSSISPDCSLELIAKGRVLYKYRRSDHELLNTLSSHAQNISAVTFSADGQYFASIASSINGDGEVVLWRTDPTVGLWKMDLGTESVYSIALSSDNSLMAVGRRNIRVYDISSQQELKSISGWAEALAFSPDNQLLAAGINSSGDTHIKLISWKDLSSTVLDGPWYLSPLTDLISPRFYTAIAGVETTSLGFTPDGKGLLVGLSDGTIQYWGIRSE